MCCCGEGDSLCRLHLHNASVRVALKSAESYRLRPLLTQRRNLKRKFLDIENTIRHSIKTFRLKLGSRGQLEGAGAN